MRIQSLAVALAVGGAFASTAGAAVSYVGGLYTESFNGLPVDMAANSNSSIEINYVDGWQDDVNYVTSTEDDVSVIGYHLYHPISPAAENGFNGNQRFRAGPAQNTGAFWAFGNTTADPEKALGSIGSTTIAGNGAEMHMGLQLINNTAAAINQFTLTYDGEQWRDGQGTTPETLQFRYSLDATDATWRSTATYTDHDALDFTSPVSANTGTSGTFVDGNVLNSLGGGGGKILNITSTVTLASPWLPGAELWLRWSDAQLASLADDGLGIDEVRFTTPPVPEPTSLAVLGIGALGLIARRRR